MKDTIESKKIVGRFVGRYIALAIIIGGISFLLENVIPQFVDWKFTAALLIYQVVLFVISTLLTIALSVKYAIKDAKIFSKEEAQTISKPIQTLLIIVALLVMAFNVVYYCGVRSSALKDAEKKYIPADGIANEYEVKCLQLETEKTYTVYGFYLASKEIVTILTFAYAVVYTEMMVENEVQVKRKTTKKSEKEEV